jgi:hypothetical protein
MRPPFIRTTTFRHLNRAYLSSSVVLQVIENYFKNFNPTPHCFIAITKATACGWKEPLLPHPLHSPVRGRGKGGASSTTLKICLIKTWVTLKLSSKAFWKLHFNENLWNKKVCKAFLRGICDFKQIFCFNHPGLIFICTKKVF